MAKIHQSVTVDRVIRAMKRSYSTLDNPGFASSVVRMRMGVNRMQGGMNVKNAGKGVYMGQKSY